MKEHGFELVPDENSLIVHVRGKTLEELFQNAVRAVASFLKDGATLMKPEGGGEKHAIHIEAVDIHSLLVDYLSKIVADSDMYGRIFLNATFSKFGENFLEGELSGYPTETFDNEIKAVSYSDVDIHKTPAGYFEVSLAFDV